MVDGHRKPEEIFRTGEGMMKSKLMQMCSVAAVMMLAMGAGSAMAANGDSATWEYFYEADDLPHLAPVQGGEFGWQDLSGGSTDNSVIVPDGSNNYLSFDYNNGDGGGSYEGFRYLGHTDGGHYPPNDPDENLFNPQTNGGISLEFRIRIHSGTFLMHMWPSSPADSRWLTMLVSDTNITINDSNDFTNNPTDVGNTNGPGEWTTIRITSDDTVWNVYRDNDQSVQATLPIVGNHGPYGLYQFALYGTQPSAVFDLDHFRWTNQGALVIPEPATMALLGLGGLAALRRRRNR
jgi:hypothetical protein